MPGILKPSNEPEWCCVCQPGAFLKAVRKHLDAGKSPDDYTMQDEECGNDYTAFKSLLGIAAHQGHVEAVKLLLDQGAKVVWPRSNLPKKWRSDDAFQDYEGLALDPLGCAISMLAGYSTENWDHEDAFWEKVGRYVQVCDLLMQHGADPTRKDALRAETPLHRMMNLLNEDLPVQWPELPLQVASSMFEKAVSYLAENGRTQELSLLAQAQFQALDFAGPTWHTELPLLAAGVQAQAQGYVLGNHTPSAGVARKVNARL